jgi:ankyrin repeat protein
VNLSAHRADGQTPLHMAVIGGHLETVKLLLRYNPPLEATNVYGGTVWGQTLWSAAHGGDPDRYIAILETLATAGAKIGGRHTPVNARVDRWLAERGSAAEPSWYWFGEKP